MNNQPQNTTQSEEIDLGYLFHKIGLFFKNCIKILFLILAFFQKYIIITILLILIGIAYGYYKDTNSLKAYDNEVIVIPNFESIDYLYSKITALNSKIKQRDTLYLKSILGDENHKYLKGIEIDPIVDLFNFASKSRENIDVLRILIQNQELETFADDIVASKYYKYHKLNINVIGKENSKRVVEKLLQYFNTNEHFTDYKNSSAENMILQIEENDNMILQIDSLITSLNNVSRETQSASVIINEVNNLHLLLEQKQELLDEHLLLQLRSTDEKEIIKEVSTNLNIHLDSGINLSRAIKYPLYLVLLFSGFFFVIYVYKKLKTIALKE